MIDRRINDGFLAVNRLLAAKQPVRALGQPLTVGTVTYPAGSWYVPSSSDSTAILKKLADENGLPAAAVNVGPGTATLVQPVRVGLWDQYGGSMPSGWTRWMFEQFEFRSRWCIRSGSMRETSRNSSTCWCSWTAVYRGLPPVPPRPRLGGSARKQPTIFRPSSRA
jgi:hypothetical protein